MVAKATTKAPSRKKAVKKKAPAKKGLAVVKIKELAPAPAVEMTQSAQVMHALVSQLNSGKLQPEQLTLVLDAQERVLDRTAKEEFNSSMAYCQKTMPQILKTGENTTTHSMFETLDGLLKAIMPVYTAQGFGVSFNTADCPIEGWVRATAEVMHTGGWSKMYQFDLPFDIAGIKGAVNKTPMHGCGSTMSYARRYLLRMIFNLITSEDIDDDGNAGGGELVDLITTDQETILEDLITETKSDKDAFLHYCKVSALCVLPASKFDQAKRALESKGK